MADLAYPASLVALPGHVQGRAPARFTGVALQQFPANTANYRQIRATTGTITDVVVVKVNGVEQPFANARIWAERLADGYKAWEGWSNATGAYTATGLEVGVDYVLIAIDPTRTHKATAAGPKTAT